jgi:hypothetical protein
MITQFDDILDLEFFTVENDDYADILETARNYCEVEA